MPKKQNAPGVEAAAVGLVPLEAPITLFFENTVILYDWCIQSAAFGRQRTRRHLVVGLSRLGPCSRSTSQGYNHTADWPHALRIALKQRGASVAGQLPCWRAFAFRAKEKPSCDVGVTTTAYQMAEHRPIGKVG
jgi:hypothetical protein